MTHTSPSEAEELHRKLTRAGFSELDLLVIERFVATYTSAHDARIRARILEAFPQPYSGSITDSPELTKHEQEYNRLHKACRTAVETAYKEQS